MANREHKPYPKHKRIALLTAELRCAFFTLYRIARRNPVIFVVELNRLVGCDVVELWRDACLTRFC